jgi:hypothetical protein
MSTLSTPDLQWQTRYILLLWLSLICLAPFDLATIGSQENDKNLVTRLIDLSQNGLSSAGKDRDACAILCARVLSRRDVWQTELSPFMIWTITLFSSPNESILLVRGLFDACLILENRIVGYRVEYIRTLGTTNRTLRDPTSNANITSHGLG